jgi:hypothetical protein
MAIQIGKYKRPGIFIEEFDNSVITTPTVTGITSLVMGFSRKGPVNTPILLQNTQDLEAVFGALDRNMERKGSFFHRTVSKMLESSPVYAMNLMLTSDTLDQIEYKSVSTRTDRFNDVERLGPYRRFFNTTGFWKRDTETFNNLVKVDPGASGRMLAFTNLSDRYISVFAFKSTVTSGFDRTLLEAYGTAEKVPLYLNASDYASDYLVDVLVVTGDWSNYAELSVDTKWSQYFSPTGLKKSRVYDFANDRNITLLKFYEGLSLIPYFRDSNGRNIFIENSINADTDMTGLFCTFDQDKLEGDFPNGMIDLVGNNIIVNNSLVDTEQETIEFLSYQETIAETLTYAHTQLDVAGGANGQQVFAFGPGLTSFNGGGAWGGLGSPNRTALLREGFINGVKYATASEKFITTQGGTTASLEFGFEAKNAVYGGAPTAWGPYCVIGGEQVFINSEDTFLSGNPNTYTFSISNSLYTSITATTSYKSVAYIDSTNGNISVKNGTVAGIAPSLGSEDLVLGYLNFKLQDGYFITSTFSVGDTPVWTNVGAKDSFEPNELTFGPTAAYDYTIDDLGSGTFKLEFQNTAGSNVTNAYERHRKLSLFNKLVSVFESTNLSRATMIVNPATDEKFSLENASVVNVTSSESSNKSITINLGTSSVPTTISQDGNFILYKIDNEFTLGENAVFTQNAQGTSATGSIGKYSDLYLDFYNGQINTGDWFYQNTVLNSVDKVTFTRNNGQDVIVFSSISSIQPDGANPISGNETLKIPSSIYNSGVFTLTGTATYSSIVDPITGTFFPGTPSVFAYTIDINTAVTDETLYNVDRIENASKKTYLDMYLDSSNNMNLRFTDSTLDAINPIILSSGGIQFKDSTLRVRTDKTNYKQTIEIEQPAGYTPVANKILINGTRYTELKVGDFLEAAVDETMLEVGQMPKKLTRILQKRAYTGDPTLTELSCDLAINKVSRYGDLQTLRYQPIADYASTYKAISLKGFRVREASMPDGTEERQSSILNLIAKGTSLYGALINKEAIDFRYVVDSFGLGLTERSKQQLVDLCGDRLDALGLLNMPSNKMFRDSTAVNFVDAEGVVQTSFIAKGGDPESNPAFLYSFGDGRGSSCVGYFYPYVTVNDNGRPANVPPAAYVASTYMRKQNSAVTSITPWTIAAGVTNGRVTNIAGIEVNFSPTDIENLNGAQMNPIVFKRNRGFVIETENTGQTLYKSALSYLHVREVLIELERELSAMLLEFQWRFNTSDVRAEIKLRADSICERYVNRNGLFNYFNKCDEENNTPEIIDNQIGVLDTYIEPIRGMGIIVNNITILRTGAIQSGGFVQS